MPATSALPITTSTRWVGALVGGERRHVLAAWVISRAVAGLALVLGASENLSKLTAGALTSWDGTWYLGIAEHGYGAPPVAGQQTHWPFFPLLPGLTRGLIELGVPSKAALVLITNAAFLAALAGVHAIARDHAGPTVARYAVWLVALFPMGVIFSMGYPSSIFLAASTWAFVFVDRHRDLAAAACALVATAVRPNGVLPLVAIVIVLVVARSPRRAAVVAAPSIAFLAVWCALLWRWTDDPIVFWSTKGAWDEVTIFEFLSGPKDGEVPHVAAGLFGLAALVAWGRRFKPAWLLFTALYVLPALALGVVGVGRYTTEAFPVIVAGAVGLTRVPPPIRVAVLVLSGLAMALFAVMVARYKYLP